MGGIVIAIWEKSNFFGSIGSQKCTQNTIFSQGGLLKPPLPHVGLNEEVMSKDEKSSSPYKDPFMCTCHYKEVSKRKGRKFLNLTHSFQA